MGTCAPGQGTTCSSSGNAGADGSVGNRSSTGSVLTAASEVSSRVECLKPTLPI